MTDYNAMSLDELTDHAGITILPDGEYELNVFTILDRRRAARDAILDLAEQLDAEGLVVVPAIPTQAMKVAGAWEMNDEESQEWIAGSVYESMLDAAPLPASPSSVEG